MGILQILKGHLTASVDSKYLPDFTKPASYLVIEDSRTIGLTGDPLDEEKGNFARFFRWIGESDKHGLDIGRFGLGKAVFPMGSQIGAYHRTHCKERRQQAIAHWPIHSCASHI